jgi:RNA recognition motif-containing protein
VQPPVAEQFKVTVSRLQWWTSDADLEELFSPYGKIRKIIFQEEKNTGKSKGVALIQFAEA